MLLYARYWLSLQAACLDGLCSDKQVGRRLYNGSAHSQEIRQNLEEHIPVAYLTLVPLWYKTTSI